MNTGNESKMLASYRRQQLSGLLTVSVCAGVAWWFDAADALKVFVTLVTGWSAAFTFIAWTE